MAVIIIEDLDKAISHLRYRTQTYINHDTLKAECFDNSSDVDVEAIIIQFRQQGFIHGGLGNSEKDFKLTVLGRIFWESVPIEYAGRPYEYREVLKKKHYTERKKNRNYLNERTNQ